MSRTWTVSQKISAGFAVALVMLLIIAVVAYTAAGRLVDAGRAVAHSFQIVESTRLALSASKDAETGQRGFLLTGLEEYLEPYTLGTREATSELSRAITLASGDALQVDRLKKVQSSLEIKFSELAETIDLRRRQGLEPALKVVLTGRGKKVMDQFREMLKQVLDAEGEVRKAREEEREVLAQLARSVILWTSILALILTAAVGYGITRSLSGEIRSSVSRLQSSSSELQSAANQQATGSRENAAAMTEISTTIRELLSTSRQIAESSQRVARLADETATGARAGDQIVLKSQEALGGISSQVNLIVNHMLQLGKKSQQVGGILDIINELADQTNILAINATIEAAGAGEQGKRFAVVADEIRRLADRVAVSTKEIRILIEEIRSAVTTTVMTTEGGAKAVDAGTRQFVEVATAFRQIVVLVQTTTEAAREIELSTQQQATAVDQVNLAISNVAQSARETEASAGQTLQTSTELATLSRNLSSLVEGV
jgi:methyl-accepting chemotaxis protein